MTVMSAAMRKCRCSRGTLIDTAAEAEDGCYGIKHQDGPPVAKPELEKPVVKVAPLGREQPLPQERPTHHGQGNVQQGHPEHAQGH